MPAVSELDDLLALGQVMDEWGGNVKNRLSVLPKLALAFNVLAARAFGGKDAQYSALDESAYQVLKKNGLDRNNEARDRATLEKALRMRDTHIRVMSRTSSAQTLVAAFSKRPDNLATLVDTAEQHQLRGIAKLLKKSFG